jgi:HlyD family secretion protein
MRRNRIKSLLLAGVPALLLVVGVIYALIPRPIPVDAARATRGPLQVTVDQEGRTRIRERYVVSAPLSGRLGRVTLHAGDSITAGGTLLASIDPSDPVLLDARTFALAQARLKGLEAALQQATANLAKIRISHHYAEIELQRITKAFESNAASMQEFNDAELKERITSEELKAATFAVQVAEFELQQGRAALMYATGGSVDGKEGSNDDAANKGPFAVRSPVSGRVLRVMQESAAVVSAGRALLEIGDPKDLEVEIDVLSRDATRMRPGARVIIEEWGGPKPLSGRVRVVEPAAFTKISALGVEEQRVWIIVDLTDPLETRAALGDRYRVEARIVVWEGANVLRLPVGSVFRCGDGWAAYRVEAGHARLTPVVLGQRNAADVEVIQGIREGDLVINYPGDRVHDGVAVSLRG